MATKEDELLKEIQRLKKVNEVLMEKALKRQEHSEAFMMFQQNATLTAQIRERTAELEKLTENLKHEQNFLESMIMAIPGVIKFINRETATIKHLNLGILGLSSGEELNNLMTSQGRFSEVVALTLQSLIPYMNMITLDLDILDHPKLSQLEVTFSSKDSNIVVVFIQDRTEIFRQRETIKNQEIQILQSNRLASLGEMAAGVAHEINNPLAIISAISKILQKEMRKETIDRDILAESVEDIQATVKRIAQIISAMRNLSRDSLNFEKKYVRLKSILEEVFSLCENRFKTNNVDLRILFPKGAEETEILCDHVQFSQVLVNLLNNGFDAVSEMPEKWVEIELVSKEDEDVIFVTDSGHGISPDILKRIFDPFFTSKDLGKGTGLGLSISKTIMEKHGGSISVDSSHPNTRFVLRFPKNS